MQTIWYLALALIQSTLVHATGCENCNGEPINDVYNRCKTTCEYQVSDPQVRQVCVDECGTNVLIRRCCLATPCPDTTTRRLALEEDEEDNAQDATESPDDLSNLFAAQDYSSCCRGCRALSVSTNLCPRSSLSIALQMAA